MKNKTYSIVNILTSCSVLILGIFLVSCKKQQSSECEMQQNTITLNHKEVKRVGMVVKIKPEHLDEYKALHADSTKGVRDLLTKYNMRNFSIFLTQLEDGNYYEFGYYEYWGADFDGDMKLLDMEPRNQAWLNVCDPMQIPIEGETGWREMSKIYSNY